jgi:hypothetical protein
MMLTPVFEITIDGNKYNGCYSFTVNNDMDDMSSTGEITFPHKVFIRKEGQREYLNFSSLVERGSSITIKAGYKEEEIHPVFSGYVKNIDMAERIRLTLEDDYYLLRKKPVVFNIKNIKLVDLCKRIVEDTGLTVSEKTTDLTVDEVKYSGSAAGCLSRIKDNLNLNVSFDAGEMFCGMGMLNIKDTINVTYGQNIVKNGMKSQFKDTNPMQVVVIGKKRDNTEVKVTVGMEGGSKKTFYRYNVTDKSTLEKIAKGYLEKYWFDGLAGKVDLFFIPFAEVGGAINYTNKNYEDSMGGKYLIKKMKYMWGSGGLRQIITPGNRL